MKRMLINATQPEETRIALVDGQNLYDLDVETPNHQKKKANIYKGKITRIEQHLEAAFVDYGSERHGFLPFKEVAQEYYPKNANAKLTISEVLKEGQEVIVQVQKEERGNKGAALTTQITLAGPYVVMMPNNPKAGGISRRIEGEDRSETRDSLSDIETPEGAGLIIRTAGVGKSTEELQWGVNYLSQLWEAIKKTSEEQPAPFLIHQESDIVILAIRDYLRQDIGEIIIDNMEVFHKARDFIQHVMPQQVHKVKPYQDTVPLFTRFQVESQIETAYERVVKLPSGGEIYIDITEALTAIDINSSRSTKGGDIEETAYHTNMEAACEIARQLRLRDLGGLVVIDFIDMHSNKHQREVENKMREAVKSDRARVQIGKISRFGLLEMSRQRLRPSIEESTQMVCPRCKGVGIIRGVESLGLSILRLLEEEAMKENTRRVTVQLPVDVATFLLNEKRYQITHIEDRQNMHILIIPNEHLDTPQYIIERVRHNEEMSSESSYHIKESINTTPFETAEPTVAVKKEEPALKNIQASTPPAPRPILNNDQLIQEKSSTPSLFSKVWKAIFSSNEPEKEEAPKETKPTETRKTERNNGRKNNRRNRPKRSKNDQDNRSERNRSESSKNPTNTTDGNNTSRRGTRRNRPKIKDPIEQTPQNNTVENKNENNEQVTETTSTEERRPRRRSRYNTRSYNGRRRTPNNAANLSIHNLPEPEVQPKVNLPSEEKPKSEDTVETTLSVEEIQTTEIVVTNESTGESEPIETPRPEMVSKVSENPEETDK